MNDSIIYDALIKKIKIIMLLFYNNAIAYKTLKISKTTFTFSHNKIGVYSILYVYNLEKKSLKLIYDIENRLLIGSDPYHGCNYTAEKFFYYCNKEFLIDLEEASIVFDEFMLSLL